MIKKATLKLAAITIFSSLTFSVYADTNTHFIVAPTCLAKNVQAQHQVLAVTEKLAFLKIDSAGVDELSEMKTEHMKEVCGGFIDVTEHWQHSRLDANTFLSQQTIVNQKTKAQEKYQVQYEAKVKALLKQINSQSIHDNLTALTNFKDRDAKAQTGVNAANWIKSTVENMVQQSGRKDVSIFFVETNGYKQPSVVMKVGNSADAGIVVGGHIDTLTAKLRPMPGADDDGSGSATVLEAARSILNSGLQFNRPIYFIWYAAEERGLVGSQSVVSYFIKQSIPVKAVMQLDMTGYEYKDNSLWLINDNVNISLTDYVKLLINTYVNRSVYFTQCGYACSDHVSWEQAGIPAAMPFESDFSHYNPNIHTPNDTMDKLVLEHMTDFAKLATAFAVELAEPV